MTQPDNTPNTNTPTPGQKGPIQEHIIFSGSPSWIGRMGAFAITWIIALLLVIVPIILMVYAVRVPWYVTTIAIIIAIVLVFVQFAFHRTIRYRITNYRIDYERGVITRRIDSLELWHAHDLFFRQTLLERMFGVASIDVLSDDQSNPRLELRSIPDGRAVFEQVKSCILNAKRQRGLIISDE